MMPSDTPKKIQPVASPFPEKFLNGYFVAVSAGLILAAAFPKFNVAGFAWIAPAIFLFAAQISSPQTGGKIFRVGYAGGLAFWFPSLYWLLLMPAPGFSILAWIALGAFLALFPATWLWLTSNFKFQILNSWAGRQLWSLGGAAAWVALEMIRARIFSGFPWNFIGASQFQLTPLIQIASVTGVYGVSFLVVWTSLCLLSAVRMIFENPKSRFAWQPEIFLPLFAVAGLFAWGEVKMAAPNPPASNLRVALVQPGFPQSLIWNENENSNRFQQLLALSEQALTNQTDLLLWPESAVPELNDANYSAITNLICHYRVWLIFNADDVLPKAHQTATEPDDVFNAAFLFSPNGHFADVYHKQHLVIFGEYVPLVDWLPFVKWFTPITGGYETGNAPAEFDLNHPDTISPGKNSVTASPLICFEDTFPQLARQAVQTNTDFLVNLTNDGWFGDSAEQWQHMAGALFRAVENGVPLVRCCNNGISCWIDGNGRVRKIFRDKNGDVYNAGAMTIDLPVSPHAQTFYNRHGDWFGWSCVAWVGIIFLRRPICRFCFRKFIANSGKI